MEVIKQENERVWYLVKEWQTKAGLNARVHKCVWKDQVKAVASLLHDFYTGYVQPLDTDKRNHYDNHDDIDVHGGVTFGGELTDITEGRWVGFDMAHIGDENRTEAEAVEECERLAIQLAAHSPLSASKK